MSRTPHSHEPGQGHDPSHARQAHSSRRHVGGGGREHAPAHDPQEAVDVARSVATLMERLRQLKTERDAARREAESLRAALPDGHPAKNAAPSSTDTDTIADASAENPDGVSAAEESLRGELTQALADKEENLNLARRVQAEFDNYRKRIQRDLPNQRREALKNFLKEFLGAFDDLDRVIAESEKDPGAVTVRQGVSLARDNLWRAMSKSGVQAIEAMGRPFDPQFHDAMTTVPSAEHPVNTVLDVFQPGYMLDDFVLRPARVVLSALPPADAADANAEADADKSDA